MKTLAELHYRLTELATPQNEGATFDLEIEVQDIKDLERDLLADGWTQLRETRYIKQVTDITFRLKIIL